MEEHEKYHGWHLDKRVSVGHLVTTAAVVAGFATWLMTLDAKIDRNTLRVDELRYDAAAHQVMAQEQFTRLDNSIQAQTKRLEGRMEAQYSEIIRRLEIMDQRMVEQIRESNGRRQ